MADKKSLSISYRELFFYMYFALMFGMRMWGVYEGTKLYAPLLIVGFALWGISVLLTDHTVLEYIVIAAFLTLAVVVYFNSGEKGLLLYFTLMLGMKGIDTKKLFKVGVIVGITGMAVMSFLTAFGFIEDVVYIQSRPHAGLVFRHALGMPHPNTLSTSFIIISVMVLYVIGHDNKLRVWKASVIILLVAIYLYIYSGSRTGIAINIGLVGLNLVYAYRRQIGIIEKIIMTIVFPVIWGISIILPAFASDDLLDWLVDKDYTLMTRLVSGKNYLQWCPITLFGTVVYDGSQNYGIDMAQLHLFLNLGVVAFVLISALTIWLVVDALKGNQIEELIIIFSFLLMGLTDPFLYNLSYKNITFVFMGEMFYKNLKNVKDGCTRLISRELRVISVGNRTFKITLPYSISAFIEGHTDLFPFAKVMIVAVTMIISFLVGIAVYNMTPKPEYVLLDRNSGEHRQWDSMEGRTYTSKEIKEIKAQGNIVLNYSGDDELMYTYYSDADNPIEGGRYAQNAPLVEKIRRSISIFFWGTVIMIGTSFVVWSKINSIKSFSR